MSKIIGIDLGTTNSCVAVMDGDQVADVVITVPTYFNESQTAAGRTQAANDDVVDADFEDVTGRQG